MVSVHFCVKPIKVDNGIKSLTFAGARQNMTQHEQKHRFDPAAVPSVKSIFDSPINGKGRMENCKCNA